MVNTHIVLILLEAQHVHPYFVGGVFELYVICNTVLIVEGNISTLQYIIIVEGSVSELVQTYILNYEKYVYLKLYLLT